MVLKANNAEGGSHGTTVTPANSGGASGAAFDTVDLSSGNGSVKYSTAASPYGTYCYEIQSPSGNGASVRWLDFSGPSLAARAYFRMTDIPAAATELIRVRNASLATMARLVVSASGRVAAQDAAGTVWTAALPAMSLNTWYRIEIVTVKGADTSTGTIKAAYYLGDGTTALDSHTGTTYNTGTDDAYSVWVGKAASSNWETAFFMDNIAAKDGTTEFIGPESHTAPASWLVA